MRKETLDALKAKFEGVSDAILGRIADKIAKTATTGEQAKAAVEAYTLQQLLEGYGDSRATEAQQTAVHNYESRYGLKDGEKLQAAAQQQAAAQPAQQPAAQDMPAWASALIDSNRALSEKLARMEAERTTDNRRQQLEAITGRLPEGLRKAYQRTSVEGLTDEQFTALAADITAEVDGIARGLAQKGAVFGRPAAQTGAPAGSGQLTPEQEAAIAHREGTPAEGQQPF